MCFVSQQVFAQSLLDVWGQAIGHNQTINEIASQVIVEQEKTNNISMGFIPKIYSDKNMFKDDYEVKSPFLESQEQIHDYKTNNSIQEFNVNVRIPLYRPGYDAEIKEKEIFAKKISLEEEEAKQHLSINLIDKYLTASDAYFYLKGKKEILDLEENNLNQKTSAKEKNKFTEDLKKKKQEYLLALDNYEKAKKEIHDLCQCNIQSFSEINDALATNYSLGTQEEWLSYVDESSVAVKLLEANLNYATQKKRKSDKETLPTIDLIGQKTFQESNKISAYTSTLLNDQGKIGFQIKIPLAGENEQKQKNLAIQQEREARTRLEESIISVKEKIKEKWKVLTTKKEETNKLKEEIFNYDKVLSSIKTSTSKTLIEAKEKKLQLMTQLNDTKHKLVLELAQLYHEAGKLNEDGINRLNSLFKK